MLVDLIADRIGVVGQAKPGDGLEFLAREHLGARVHRGVDQNQLGAPGECRLQGIERQRPVRRLEPDQPRHGAGAAHDRQIGIVERLDQNHLVAGLDEPEQGARQRFGSARGDYHLARPVDLQVVEPFGVRGHRLAQGRDAHHRWILVDAVRQVVRGRGDHVVRPVAVRESLAEIDRVVLLGEPRHDLEDGRAVAGKNFVAALHLPFSEACAARPVS